ncbi:MAG: DUF2523 family protein [Limisphaerales bacterium]
MDWYYAINNEQKGPISEEEFQQLVRAGKISQQTLVWQENLPNWVPYKDSPAAKTTTDESGNPIIFCAGCGQSFPVDQVVKIGGIYSCAACKPVVIQKIHEGGELQANEGLSVEELKNTDYNSSVADCIGRGFRTFTGAFFPIIGTSFVVFLMMILFNVVPFLGFFLNLFLAGALWGGYWYYLIRHARNEPAAVGDVFYGFSNGFLQLMLANIVVQILIFVPLMPGFGLMLVGVIASGGGDPSEGLMLGAGGLMFLGFPVMIYLSLAWFFTMPLVIDKRMSFWPAMGLSRAMVNKHWWGTFGIGFVFWFILSFAVGLVVAITVAATSAGGIPPEVLGIMVIAGIFIALGGGLPWLFSAYAHRYRDMFERLAVQDEF